MKIEQVESLFGFRARPEKPEKPESRPKEGLNKAYSNELELSLKEVVPGSKKRDLGLNELDSRPKLYKLGKT